MFGLVTWEAFIRTDRLFTLLRAARPRETGCAGGSRGPPRDLRPAIGAPRGDPAAPRPARETLRDL